MKKEIIKRIIISVLIFAVFVCALLIIDDKLKLRSEHGIMQAQCMYLQPKDTIDVVFMGSSRIHCDVNTSILWEDYGIAAYDFSAAEQPLWITYYYLQEFCKYQTPKLVVLDVYAPCAFKKDYQYYWLKDNMNGLKFSLNKLKILYAACEPEKYSVYMPSFWSYHNNYYEPEDAEPKHFLLDTPEEQLAFKGYTPYFRGEDDGLPELTDEIGEITPKSEKYLKKIIEYARKNNIELMFVANPSVTIAEDCRGFNRMAQIAEANGIPFYDLNYYADEMGLNYATQMSDESHLNFWGGEVLAPFLGKLIKENYDIPDHRGDPVYSSWSDTKDLIMKWRIQVAQEG